MLKSRQERVETMPENSRYYITVSQNVPGAGGATIRMGYPISLHTINDICICCRGSYERIPLNSFILRDALLSSPALLAQLGLEVKELKKEEEQKPQPRKKKETPKEAE